MKWRFFFGACVLVGYGMLAMGAPPFAVGAGVAVAGLFNVMKRRSLALKQSGR